MVTVFRENHTFERLTFRHPTVHHEIFAFVLDHDEKVISRGVGRVRIRVRLGCHRQTQPRRTCHDVHAGQVHVDPIIRMGDGCRRGFEPERHRKFARSAAHGDVRRDARVFRASSRFAQFSRVERTNVRNVAHLERHDVRGVVSRIVTVERQTHPRKLRRELIRVRHRWRRTRRARHRRRRWW